MTEIQTRPTRGHGRSKRATAAVAAAALVVGVGGVLASAPAQADTTVTEGSLDWGFREAFRTYVGNQTAALPPIGALPIGERITVEAPATFDPDGTPSIAGRDETRPFIFPATGTEVVSTTDLTVETDGAAVFHFPSHAFTVTIENPGIVVNGATKSIVADVEVVIPENSIGETPGTYGGTDVVLGDVGTVDTVIAGDGLSATITGSDISLSAAGAAALQDFLAEGADLDDFTATVTLEDPAAPAVPEVSVSKTEVNPAGDTITVTGTGFDSSTTLGTRPPLSGQPAGTYVVFGTFADSWQPSLGSTLAPSSNRRGMSSASGGQKWAVPAASMATIGGTAGGAIELTPEGTFTATLNVKRDFTTGLPAGFNYGVYTYPGSGATNAAFETYTPITFTAAEASAPGVGAIVQPGDSIDVEGSGFNDGETVDVVLHSDPVTIGSLTADSTGAVSGSVTIPNSTPLGSHELYLEGAASGVEVLAASFSVGNPDLTAFQTITTEVVPTGALTISVLDDEVVLPSPELSPDAMSLVTSGALNPVTVADLRTADPGWSVTGTITDFSGAAGTFEGGLLTWTPEVLSTGAGQTVTAGEEAAGLEAGKVLGSALADQGRGTAELGADLSLTLPTTVDPGEYTATLTLTVV
jgi:hypothetical protein